MRSLAFASLFAVALGLTGGRPARAEFFDYSTSVTLSNPTAGTTISGSPGTSVTVDFPGNGLLTVAGTNAASGTHTTGTGVGSQVVFSTMTFSGLDQTTPANPLGFNFTYNLTLTDFATATSTTPLGTGVATITGRIDGTVGAGVSVNLNQVTGYSVAPNPVNVGGVSYNVALQGPSGLFFTPAGPSAANPGTLGARISVTAVPEPASIVLVSLGLLGLSRRRRRPNG